MENEPRRCHTDLILWQKAMELAVRVHKLCAALPKYEIFGLASQMRRASISVPSNIAEGTARKSTKEFIHFLHIARGSMAELQTQLQLALRIGYLAQSEVDDAQLAIDEVGRILNAVLAGLKRKLI